MCGLSGYSGIKEADTRFNLVVGLGSGIDDRGGHAAGYVSVVDKTLRFAKRAGEWMDARYRFIETASKGDLCMMHARWATCGKKDAVAHAHPFAIRRNGKVVLWGAHNGIIYDAWDSAKEHKRNIDVDSQEIFELIADREFKTLNKLNGYGVITWIEAGQLDHVKLARLTEQSEICVVKTKEGGVVWGSTWEIVSEALDDAELHCDFEYKLDKIGQVYHIRPDGVYHSDLDCVKLDDDWTGGWSYGWRSNYGEYSSWSTGSAWKGGTTSNTSTSKSSPSPSSTGFCYGKGRKWSKEFLATLTEEDRKWLLEDEEEEEKLAKKEQEEDEERGKNWMEEYKRMCESDPDEEDAQQEAFLKELEAESSKTAATCISKDDDDDDGALSVEPPSSDYSIDVIFDDEGEDDDTTVDDDFMRMWDKHNNPPAHLSKEEKKFKDGRLERGTRSSRFLLKGM